MCTAILSTVIIMNFHFSSALLSKPFIYINQIINLYLAILALNNMYFPMKRLLKQAVDFSASEWALREVCMVIVFLKV
jgi:hypothetical protein